MPVIWLIIFKPLMLSLFLKWLTINVSVLHHRNAPDNIDIIATGYSQADCVSVRKLNRANKAINTNSTSGFEIVSPSDVK